MSDKHFKLLPLVDRYGISNIIFVEQKRPLRGLVISYTSTIDDTAWVVSKIIEERYPLKDNYKVTLTSVGTPVDIDYGADHYYITDLESLVRQGSINVYVLTNGQLINWKDLDDEDDSK